MKRKLKKIMLIVLIIITAVIVYLQKEWNYEKET